MEIIANFVTIIALWGPVIVVPIFFLVLCIRNAIKVSKMKENNEKVDKSLIVNAIIFGVIFTVILIFYVVIIYIISTVDISMM